MKFNLYNFGLVFLIIVFIISSPISVAINKYGGPEEITYNEFIEKLEEGSISAIKYYPMDEDMLIYFHTDATRDLDLKERKDLKLYSKDDTRLVTNPKTETFIEDMLKLDIALVKQKVSINFTGFILNILMAWLFIGLLLYLKDLVGSQAKFGDLKESSIMIEKGDITTKYSDVIGHDEAIEELKYMTSVINKPELGEHLKAEMPHGLLFIGPPGTGKTLVARAIAGECGTKFIYMNGSSFVEQFVGTGAKRVRQLFKIARKYPSCIIFIDELDAVGASRENEMSNAEYRQTINALLQEMDGFDKNSRVLVIGATNNPDMLSKALTRAGRFDRQITFNPPSDFKTRLDLLNYYFMNRPKANDVDLVALSKQTSGLTGADIATLANNASLVALQKNHNRITMSDIMEAFDRVLLKGSYKDYDKEEDKFRTVVYHEAGHAVMHYLLNVPIARVCVKGSTADTGGFVAGECDETKLISKQDIINQIMILYAGRISEEIKFGEDMITIGAVNDIQKATSHLKNYIGVLGFGDNSPKIDWTQISKYDTKDDMLKDITEISTELYNDTKDLLMKNYALVEKLADYLSINDNVSGEEVINILKK